MAWLVVVLSVATFFRTTQRQTWPMIVGSLLLLLRVILGMIASRMVTTKKVDGYHVRMIGIHPDYLA